MVRMSDEKAAFRARALKALMRAFSSYPITERLRLQDSLFLGDEKP